MSPEQQRKVDAALYTRKTVTVPRGTALTSEETLTSSAWMGEEGAALRNGLDEMTRRMARTVAALREWRTLEYIGIFIDLPDEQKAAVEEVAARTETVLREWGYEMEPRPSPIDQDQR